MTDCLKMERLMNDMTNEKNINIPTRPAKSFRITLNLNRREDRMDNVLLEALRTQEDHLTLRTISRTGLKGLFNENRVLIKGQRAKTSSSLAKGTTYVDILGY